MLKYHIQTIEVGASGAADITFNNIPQDYDDLIVQFSLRCVRSGDPNVFLSMKVNNSTSNISGKSLWFYNTTVYSSTFTFAFGTIATSGATANTFSSGAISILNYSSTTSQKSMSSETMSENNGIGGGSLTSSLYASTSPITSFSLYRDDANLSQYSSASLYGIKRGSSGEVEVASGGTITTSGGYTIHTFTSSGTFVANRDMTVEALVVAGGGAGGVRRSGGGGGGGYIYSQEVPISSGTSYAITVGAGGASTPYTDVAPQGNNGSSSVFASLSALGGGGGGGLGSGNNNGRSGGSGGGASFSGAIGTGTVGQGNDGGLGQSSANPNNGGGGGGGAGGVGGSMASGSKGGTGGAGAASSITGTSVIRAWGGAGGGFSTMGDGATGSQGSGTGANAGANTGGGGNGMTEADRASSGAGGSGIVIIRYLTPAQ